MEAGLIRGGFWERVLCSGLVVTFIVLQLCISIDGP